MRIYFLLVVSETFEKKAIRAFNVRHAKSIVQKYFESDRNIKSVDLCTSRGVWSITRNTKWRFHSKNDLKEFN